MRKRLEAINSIADRIDKWEQLTAFSTGEMLSFAEPSLAREAQNGINELLKDPVVRKEQESSQKYQMIVEMEQNANRDRSKSRKKESLSIIAAAYRDLSGYFKDTRSAKRAAADFERLKKDLQPEVDTQRRTNSFQ